MTETDLEHIYIICENVGANKNALYTKLYLDIKKMYGAKGIEILELIQKQEELKAVDWILKNREQHLMKMNEYKFDLKKLEYNQMTLKEFNLKYQNFYKGI
jgi:hypothetical protein